MHPRRHPRQLPPRRNPRQPRPRPQRRRRRCRDCRSSAWSRRLGCRSRKGRRMIKVALLLMVLITTTSWGAAPATRRVSFKLDVMPVFMAAGCNTGSCHGSARGQDGFRLSLFGYDPDGDYFRITREMPTRRINLGQPHESLLLLKAIGAVPHTGGTRFTSESPYYATLRRWIEAGAPNDPPTIARPVALEIQPKQIVLEGPGTTQVMT